MTEKKLLQTSLNQPTNQPTNRKNYKDSLAWLHTWENYSQNLANKTAPLRLLEKDTIYSFDKSQKEALQDLKKMICQTPTLKYLSSKILIKVSSDAYTQGLRALLDRLHEKEWHPIAYHSSSLTSAETNNCPLELEILSILFACQYFREYI